MRPDQFSQMMKYLTRPSMSNGGLLEEYYGKSELQYQQAVKDGFQGTYEEYLRLMSPTKSFDDGGRNGFQDGTQGGRPIKTTGVSAYIREVLGKLPKGSKFNAEALAREIIKKFPDSSKSFIDKRDGSVTASTILKIIKRDKSLIPLELKPYTQSEKTIMRVQNFIDKFIKTYERNPTVGEVKIGAQTDPTQLAKYKEAGKIKGMQDTVFDAHRIAINYLNSAEKPTIKGLQNLIGNAPIKDAETLLSNMYRNTLEAMRNRAAGIDSPRSVYKNFSIKELDALKRKVRAVPGYKDNFSRQIEDLVSEAYKGQDKKLNRALKKIGKYKKLNSELQKLGINLQLDHPLSYDFIEKAKQGADPEELIRVKPIPDRVNLFKSNLDNKLIEVSDILKKQPGNKNALNLYKDIQSIAGDLQIGVGKISKGGNIISAQAAKIGDVPLLPDVKKGAEIQNAFREFVKKISNDPRVKRLGINLKELKDLAKLPKVDGAKYNAAINKFIQKSGKFGLPFVIGAGGIDFLKKQGIGFDQEFEPTADLTGSQIVPKGLSTEGKIAAGTTATLPFFNPVRQGVGKGLKATGKILSKFAIPIGIGAEAYFAKQAYDEGKSIPEIMAAPFLLDSKVRQAQDMLRMKPEERQAVNREMIEEDFSGLSSDFYTPTLEGVDDVDIQKVKERVLQERLADEAIRREERKAGGGIDKLAGIDLGPPPESGPNSQGLQGLLKRVRKG